MEFCLRKRRAGDQKPSPATKIAAATIEANTPMVKTVLTIELALSPEWGRNLMSPIPSPRLQNITSNPTAEIVAEAKPTASGE